MKLVIKAKSRCNNVNQVAKDAEDGDVFRLTDKDGDILVIMKTDQDSFVCIATSNADEYDLGIVWTWIELEDHCEDWDCHVLKVHDVTLTTE